MNMKEGTVWAWQRKAFRQKSEEIFLSIFYIDFLFQILEFVHWKEQSGFILKKPWRLFFVNVSEKGPCDTLSTRLTSLFKKPRSLWKTWSHLMTIGLARAQALFHPTHFLFTDRLSHSVIYNAPPPNSHPKNIHYLQLGGKRKEPMICCSLRHVKIKQLHFCFQFGNFYPSFNSSPVLDVSVQPWRSVIM